MESKFENIARNALENYWSIKLESKKIKISGIEKTFDFVSTDGKIIGDAKFVKGFKKIDDDKLSNIVEDVWLLEKTKAEKKFIIFGGDKNIPKTWLNKFGDITDIMFYYLNDNKIEKLNNKEKKIDELYTMSVWSEDDLKIVNEVRENLNKWNPEKYYLLHQY
ncbi:MAG TPA: hypothetical protein DEP28_01195 [Bacteroidetes bacterium]|nr:hypothetical protein [Bacteroidota bacterium]